LDPHALVHETDLRLAAQRRVVWKNRKHLYGVASQTMQRILKDYARYRNAEKRGGAVQKVSISTTGFQPQGRKWSPRDLDLALEMDRALTRLEARDATLARIVRLRYYDDLSLVQLSELLGIPTRTVSRKLRVAKAILFHELNSFK
jgi:RNA polymerase sigma factor (TIGR02999 family)